MMIITGVTLHGLDAMVIESKVRNKPLHTGQELRMDIQQAYFKFARGKFV